MTHYVTRTTFQVLSIGLLISSVAWIIYPFATSIIWAAMIVVTTWPVLLYLQARLKCKRMLATAIITALLLLVFIIPVLLVIAVLGKGADAAYVWVKSISTFIMPSPPGWLENIPFAGMDFGR